MRTSFTIYYRFHTYPFWCFLQASLAITVMYASYIIHLHNMPYLIFSATVTTVASSDSGRDATDNAARTVGSSVARKRFAANSVSATPKGMEW